MVKIIDYKAGNAPSVLNAVLELRHNAPAGLCLRGDGQSPSALHLGYKAELAQTPADLDNATHIILPGVGSAKATMDSLREMGIIPALERKVLHDKVAFLGICVGMQILFEHSEEDDTRCLGWLGGKVVKFKPPVRVPQMGWNNVQLTMDNGQLSDYYYFVNSYYAVPQNKADIWGTADYGGTFTAAVRRGNIHGTQFHCEKSGAAGLELLERWINNVD
jgi:glutamine amidotransferase